MPTGRLDHQRSSCCSVTTMTHSLGSNPLMNDDHLKRMSGLQQSEKHGAFDSISKYECRQQRKSRGPSSRRCNSHAETPSTPSTKSHSRRVHFSPTDSNSKVLNSAIGKLVTCLPWTDEEGIESRYTGRINSSLQPHGEGVLVYKDGETKTCIWEDGRPLKYWRPRRKLSKQRPPKSSDSCSNDTYLPHLELGDTGTPQDMLQEFDPVKFSSLQEHDFAFVLRSDGKWTYAIISDRRMEAIRFVVDFNGDTKTCPRSAWASRIRLVNHPQKKVIENQPPTSPKCPLRCVHFQSSSDRPISPLSCIGEQTEAESGPCIQTQVEPSGMKHVCPPPPFMPEEKRLSLFD